MCFRQIITLTSGIALPLSGLKLLMALGRIKNKLLYEVIGRFTPVVIQIG